MFIGVDAQTFLLVGILGGFTTFSAFNHDTMSPIRDGDIALALLKVGVLIQSAQVLVGLGAEWLALHWLPGSRGDFLLHCSTYWQLRSIGLSIDFTRQVVLLLHAHAETAHA